MPHAWEDLKEVELDAGPEQVWEAIATGPGMDSWYMGHSQVEPGVGGLVRTEMGAGALEATVTHQRRTGIHHPGSARQDRQRASLRGTRRRDPDGAWDRQPRQAPAPWRRLRHGSSPTSRARPAALKRS